MKDQLLCLRFVRCLAYIYTLAFILIFFFKEDLGKFEEIFGICSSLVLFFITDDMKNRIFKEMIDKIEN